jgi:hypothetical protein
MFFFWLAASPSVAPSVQLRSVLCNTMIIALRLHSIPFARFDKPQRSTPYPPAEAIFVTPPGISPVAYYARSESNFLRTSFERTYKIASTGQTRSMTPSAGLPTNQPLLDSLTVSGHSWPNSVMAGFPSVYAEDDVSPLLISVCNAKKSRLFPICTAARFVHLGVIGFGPNSTGTLKRSTLQPTYAA